MDINWPVAVLTQHPLSFCPMIDLNDSAEWLEADGLGGFASGTAVGVRTRRYHALLLVASNPPSGRLVLVNGFEAWLTVGDKTTPISSQRYAPDITYPDGSSRLKEFQLNPWPLWNYQVGSDLLIEQQIFVPYGKPAVILRWRKVGKSNESLILNLRPFLSGRDYHSLHHQNASFNFDAQQSGRTIKWQPYQSLPQIIACSNGDYRHQPEWYQNFLYEQERERGLDYTEDLASPGIFKWDLTERSGLLVLSTLDVVGADQNLEDFVAETESRERTRRSRFHDRLEQSIDSYLVKRGAGKTIIAGYPWFGDWGRDTFISLRGLCLRTGRLTEARDILLEWSHSVSNGMLPNRFPDKGEAPEFNSVDASLWYIIAIDDYLRTAAQSPQLAGPDTTAQLEKAIDAILTGYFQGTRYGIHADTDALLCAGEPGLQLTWMDAKVGNQVITPRIGKPVEVQALWLNALAIGARFSSHWQSVFRAGCNSFHNRFWQEEIGYLCDVIDVDYRPGIVDTSLRPNQIFAIGGLPLVLLPPDRARKVVDKVEAELYTPLGLRTLARGEPQYAPRYVGDVWHRDSSYHQGTAWPWLLGAFVEAWLRVRGITDDAKTAARTRFFLPIWKHLDQAGLNHVSEITDAEAPFTPRGCPFQAWSLGEVLRLNRLLSAK